MKGHLARACGAYTRKVQEREREQKERTQNTRAPNYAEKAGGQSVDMVVEEEVVVAETKEKEVVVAETTEKESTEVVVAVAT